MFNNWRSCIAVAVVLCLISLVDTSHAQVGYWQGRAYTPDSFPRAYSCNCRMCDSLRQQWSAWQKSQPVRTDANYSMNASPVKLLPENVTHERVIAWQPETVQDSKQSEVRYRQEPRTVLETRYRRICHGSYCTYHPYQVRVTRMVTVPYRVAVPDKSAEPSKPTLVPPMSTGATRKSSSALDPLQVTELVATPQEVVDEMLRLLSPASSEVVFDLGSGDGRVLFSAARNYGCIAVGVELDADRVELTRKRAELLSIGHRVLVFQGDVLDYDLAEADCVTMYLYPELMAEAVKDLKSGTRVASYAHPIQGVECVETTVDIDGAKHCIFTGTIE